MLVDSRLELESTAPKKSKSASWLPPTEKDLMRIAILLSALALISCGDEVIVEPNTVPPSCSVLQLEDGAKIVCPDGSEAVIKDNCKGPKGPKNPD